MLVLISGQGALPALIVAASKERPLIASLEQFLPDDLAPDLIFRLENLGTFLDSLKRLGITEVCFAGSIRRPEININLIDDRTKKISDQLLEAINWGDDKALGAVIKIFETSGFNVVGMDVVMPNCFPGSGIMTKRLPSLVNKQDAKRAELVLNQLSPLDVGQGCIIANNQVLAIEAFGGTDWMLRSIFRRPLSWPEGGILFKSLKIGQDRRVDVPVIGLDTITQAKESGLNGIVIQHGDVVILNRDHVIKKANELDLFIWVREADF